MSGALGGAALFFTVAGCGDGAATTGVFADASPSGDPDAMPRPPNTSGPALPPPCPSEGQADSMCDFTELSGIDRVQLVHPAEITGGLALFDADGDGDLDLFAAGGREASGFYLNDGTGRFHDGTESAGLAGVHDASGVAAGDLDGDGDQDLVVAGHDTPYRLFENNGDGTFQVKDVNTGLGGEKHEGMSVVLHDVDNDGLLDIYVANWLDLDQSPSAELLYDYEAEPNLLYRNRGGLRFSNLTGNAGVSGGNGASLAAAFFDSNGDGITDLHVANDFGMGATMQPNLDLRGNGDGTFSPASPASGAEVGVYSMTMSPGDFDNDGDLDIYTTNIGRNVLLENDGTGHYTDITVAANVEAYGFIDDQQPYLDYPNHAAGTLGPWAEKYLYPERPGHTTTGWAANWLDYDHDGDLDLHVCNGYLAVPLVAPEARRQPNVLYRNNGDRTFEDVTSIGGVGDRGDARSCVTGDIDGDGDLDIIVGNNGLNFDPAGGRLTVLRNDAAKDNWLQVQLRGTTSNREGIGAIVRARRGTTTQMRVISGGDGFLGTSMRRAHFGLGGIPLLDEVTVTWPSGATSSITGVVPNQILTITEP